MEPAWALATPKRQRQIGPIGTGPAAHLLPADPDVSLAQVERLGEALVARGTACQCRIPSSATAIAEGHISPPSPTSHRRP